MGNKELGMMLFEFIEFEHADTSPSVAEKEEDSDLISLQVRLVGFIPVGGHRCEY